MRQTITIIFLVLSLVASVVQLVLFSIWTPSDPRYIYLLGSMLVEVTGAGAAVGYFKVPKCLSGFQIH
jgi:hypothetical protein